MNRLPRRASNINPPLRGRLAASLSLRPKQRQQYAPVANPSRPTMAKSDRRRIISNNLDFVGNNYQSDSPRSPESTPPGKVEDLGNKETVLADAINPINYRSQSPKELTFDQKLSGFIILLILLLLLGNFF